jgi:hypothetical protein
MTDEDEETYRKNVRVMAAILAAIVLTIFIAIYIPPLVNPVRGQFSPKVVQASPYGFTLGLALNSTEVDAGQGIGFSFWLNNTSNQYLNLSFASPSGFQFGNLWFPPCVSGWPLGLTVMQGYYSQDNISLGVPLQLPAPAVECPAAISGPTSLLLQPHSTSGIAKFPTGLVTWTLDTTAVFNSVIQSGSPARFSGVYTAVLADEWGDVLVTHFRAG